MGRWTLVRAQVRALGAVLVASCAGGGEPGRDVTGVDVADGPEILLGETPCDPLVPEHCLLPWPSDRYLVADASTETGYRLQYLSEAVPTSISGAPFDPAAWTRMDGVSPSGQILAAFPVPPDLSAAAFHDSIDRSLDPASPTALIDLQTGQLLPHWVELDARAEPGEPVLVFVRTVQRLEEDRAYGVAFRDLVDANEQPVPVSDAFRAQRDRLSTDDPDLTRRQADADALFDALEAAGWARDALTLAWRFHTASGDAIRGDLLHIVADGAERLGPDGLGCTIDEVVEPFGESHRWVRGTIRVPSYVDSPTPPARFVRGAGGRPAWVEDVDVSFSAVIPASLAADPRPERFVFYGHGLMGNHVDYSQAALRAYAERQQLVLAVTNWAGMSADDLEVVTQVLADISAFPAMAERLQQGMVNQIALSRTLAGVCRTDPAFQVDGVNLIDPEQVYLAGGSQGGIFGQTLMAVHPDIDRAMLFVGGGGYPFMMERSIDFVPFLPLFELAYPSRNDRAIVLSLVQHLWDTTDGASYAPFLDGSLLGRDDKRVLMVIAHNDSQVPNLASDYAMRTAGLPLVEGTSRTPWGFPTVAAPFAGSAYLSIDLGDRPVPAGNEAPTVNDLGHSLVGDTEATHRMVDGFLRPGGVVDPGCDGVCDPD